ncbi:MAG: hypothetical protein Q4A66_09160 [Eubacteriales bacterium]|nr:hypothetical protein [Eubacteriales bacterium]
MAEMADTMYELPSLENTAKCTIDRDAVLKTGKPTVLTNPPAKKPRARKTEAMPAPKAAYPDKKALPCREGLFVCTRVCYNPFSFG